MLNGLFYVSNVLAAGGFAKFVQDELIRNWIGPVFIAIIALSAIYFAIKKSFRAMGGFILVATVAALLIYAGPYLFGADGKATGLARDTTDRILNTVVVDAPQVQDLQQRLQLPDLK